LVYATLLGCLSPALSIVSLLSGRTPFLMPMEKKDEADRAKRRLARGESSDHAALLHAYEEWCVSRKGLARFENRQTVSRNRGSTVRMIGLVGCALWSRMRMC